MIKARYAEEGSTSLIVPKLPQWIARCQSAGIQVALNTGYPKEIQAGLLKGLGLDGMVDHWISMPMLGQIVCLAITLTPVLLKSVLVDCNCRRRLTPILL